MSEKRKLLMTMEIYDEPDFPIRLQVHVDQPHTPIAVLDLIEGTARAMYDLLMSNQSPKPNLH